MWSQYEYSVLSKGWDEYRIYKREQEEKRRVKKWEKDNPREAKLLDKKKEKKMLYT